MGCSFVWRPSQSQTLRRRWRPVESSANSVICLWQLLRFCLQMKYQPLCPVKLNSQPILLGAKCIDCYINHPSARPFSDYLLQTVWLLCMGHTVGWWGHLVVRILNCNCNCKEKRFRLLLLTMNQVMWPHFKRWYLVLLFKRCFKA